VAQHPESPEKQAEEEERPEGAPELSEHEIEKAKEEESLSADITHEVIRREGEEELKRSNAALAWSGLAAGLAMGFSFVGEGVLKAHLPPDAIWAPLVSKLGYSFGFLIVILGSQQLFTENTLTAIVPLLARREAGVLANVARLWAIVLVTNLVGALIFAGVAGRTELFSPEVNHALHEIGAKTVESTFWVTVLKAVFAGWLIALLVWMLPAAETSHVFVIVLVTWLVSAGEFKHVIAGANEVFYMAWTGALGWGETFTRFLIPTLIGNVLGGVTLVSALNHAQVTAGGGKSHG
jgi:formate/nitrite transporter FocA (FNT family)